MAWDDTFAVDAAAEAKNEAVEIVGANLRVTGSLALGRFGRLTDLINASSGYLRVRDAQLRKRNGQPTNLTLSELMIDQDEIEFIAQNHADRPEPGSATGFVEPVFDATIEARRPRPFVMFTPGHTLTGNVHIFGQTDLAGFVDSTDPRFVPVTEVTARSLADVRIVDRYDFVLVNRTQMIAVAEGETQAPE
jgi:hypothetical protein